MERIVTRRIREEDPVSCVCAKCGDHMIADEPTDEPNICARCEEENEN